MSVGFLDSETRSHVPISYGTDLYLKHCEAIIWTYAVDNDEVGLWEPLKGPAPKYFLDMLRDPKLPLVAHQTPFDRGVLLHSKNTRSTKIPLERWRCTRAQAYSHGLPGSLDLLPRVLGLPLDEQKDKRGKALIQKFCVPKDTVSGVPVYEAHEGQDWEDFCTYAKQDTNTLRAVYNRLPKHNYQTTNLEVWHIDQLINERGFGFDEELACAAVKLLDQAKLKSDRLVQELTGGSVGAATQRGKLLSFLQEKYGAQVENLRAATIREWLEQDDLEPGLRLLLETRLEAAKSSGAKYKRGIRMCGPGSRMRYTLQFCGAGRTGRSSGKGFQPHNMARPTMKAKYIDDIVIPGIKSGEALDWPELYGGPNTACANALRHSIVAAPGNDLIVADYSNIESRVLAWLAGEGWKLDAYRSGQDLYKILYARFFGGSVETVTDHQRQSAKVVELSMGFGGGVGAFVTMAAGYQIDLSTLPAMVIPTADAAKLTKADTAWRRAIAEGNDYGLAPDVFVACDVLKQAYRESNSEINRLRYDIDSAVRRAVAEPGVSTVVGRCTIWCANSALLIQLPNGDRLVYYAPKLHTTVYTDPLTGKKSERQHISYATARGKSWLREKAWAGLFLENIVQAVANRLLRDGIRAAHRNTLAVPAIAAFLETLPPSERTAICLHVHDELALDVPRGSYTVEQLVTDMTTNSPWAAGLPLMAEGWCNPRYGKR